MKKLKALLFFVIFFSFTSSAYAVENGKSELGNDHVVVIRNGGTGFLYSERIVITASHILRTCPDGNHKTLQSFWVGNPGDNIYSTEHTEIEKIFDLDTFECYRATPGGTLSYKDDFAVVVLKTPIKMRSQVELASKELLNDMINNNDFVSFAGYGLSSAENRKQQIWQNPEPMGGTWRLLSNDQGLQVLNSFKNMWNRNYFQPTIYVSQPKNDAAICDGDSGGGFYTIKNNKYYYLGLMNGGMGNSNCGVSDPNFIVDGMFGLVPAFDNLELIKQAQDYIKQQESLEKKKIKFVCYKGKYKKTMYGSNILCPKGYKLSK